MPETDSRRARAIEFCEMTREQRARVENSTQHIIASALAAGLSVEQVAEHAGLTVEQVNNYKEGSVRSGTRVREDTDGHLG